LPPNFLGPPPLFFSVLVPFWPLGGSRTSPCGFRLGLMGRFPPLGSPLVFFLTGGKNHVPQLFEFVRGGTLSLALPFPLTTKNIQMHMFVFWANFSGGVGPLFGFFRKLLFPTFWLGSGFFSPPKKGLGFSWGREPPGLGFPTGDSPPPSPRIPPPKKLLFFFFGGS